MFAAFWDVYMLSYYHVSVVHRGDACLIYAVMIGPGCIMDMRFTSNFPLGKWSSVLAV